MSPYWANTSSNRFIGTLVRESGRNLKVKFEDLLKGEEICTTLDEQIVFSQLRFFCNGNLEYASCQWISESNKCMKPISGQDGSIIIWH